MSTAKIGNLLLDKDILLESGTNELEVLVFRVADFTFGINVAKVREVLPAQEITRLAKSHPAVRGVFSLRDRVVPVVSLWDYLGGTGAVEERESRMILADFNLQQTAFLVDSVERIHRLSWKAIHPAPSLMASTDSPITAVTQIENRLVLMLDLEMIIDHVTDKLLRGGPVANTHNLPRQDLRLVLADDSPTVRRAITQTLAESGYTRLEVFENGATAWNWLESQLAEVGPEQTVADLVISDVEMPQIDGLHLTKRIKDHPRLRSLPVLLYSSIVTPDNHKKGAAVGADAQVSKPELAKVVELADDLIRRSRGIVPSASSPAPKAPAPLAAPQPISTKSVSQAHGPSTSRPAALVASAPVVTSAKRVLDPRLWPGYCEELERNAAALRKLVGNPCSGSAVHAALRTLHTIKSAAMVVPVDEITQVTHLVESLLATQTEPHAAWPTESLGRYLSWLENVSAHGDDPDRTLSCACELQAELAEELARLA